MAVNAQGKSGGQAPHEVLLQRMTRDMDPECEHFFPFLDQELEKLFRKANEAAAAAPTAHPTHVAGVGISMIQSTLLNRITVGRIPRRLYSFSRAWGISEQVPDFDPVSLNLSVGGTMKATGVTVPCFGKITTFSIEASEEGLNAAGDGSLRLINETQNTVMGGLPNVADGATERFQTYRSSDALVVLDLDVIRLQASFAIGAPTYADWFYNCTFTVEEYGAYVATGLLVPDATGVYIRNNDTDDAGVPYCERIDRAFWLYFAGGFWGIGATVGDVTNYWKGPASTANPAGAYAPQGTVTGTLILAAQED